MIPALFLIPLVALFRIFMAWHQGNGGLHAWSWLPGFMPLAAVSFCAGVYLPRRLALVIPLGVLMLSDAIIDAHYGPQYHFFSDGPLANYALLALIGLGGMTLRRVLPTRSPGFVPVLGATLLGSVFFYVASNTLVWIGASDYPRNAAGWLQALTDRVARLFAVVRFFPKRACQRCALFYGVRRWCPPDAAAWGTHPFLPAGARRRSGRNATNRRPAVTGLSVRGAVAEEPVYG